MSYSELRELPHLHDLWIAIDPAGGEGIAWLRSGAAVVDCDAEIDELCRRIAAAERTSLTIVYAGDRPSA